MSENKEGFVARIFTNEGTNARGAWYAKSFKIADANGNEDPFFFQMGFNVSCPFTEGDYIKFQANPKDAKAMTMVEGTGTIVPAGNAPQQVQQPKKKSGGGNSYKPAADRVKQSELFGAIGGFNTEDDISRMSWSAARTHALAAVSMLLEHGGVPIAKATGAAGVSKRFDEITSAIDKLTVEYYYDSATRRKLKTVADSGKVVTTPDKALPDQVAEAVAPPLASAPPAEEIPF